MMTQQQTQTIRISIAKDFARVPGPRFKFQGKNSGEEFYETKLLPSYLEAEKTGQKLVIDFDGSEGYTSAFLDQSFGTLARTFGFKKVTNRIQFITISEPYLENEVLFYMKQVIK